MQFLNPEWFRGFWLVLAVVLFYLSVSRRKKALLTRFAHVQSIATLTRSHSSGKEFLQKSLLISAFILILLALAQPQWGEIQKEVQRKGREIVFLVDTSLSMLAEDVEPGRIEKAKLEMKSFLRKLHGDRIGIVTFAGSGFVQSPLTLDYDAFLLFANAFSSCYLCLVRKIRILLFPPGNRILIFSNVSTGQFLHRQFTKVFEELFLE